MEEETRIAKIVAIVLCVFVLSFSSCTASISIHDNQTMSDMVKNGADPISARCAVKGSGDNSSVCALLATKNDR